MSDPVVSRIVAKLYGDGDDCEGRCGGDDCACDSPYVDAGFPRPLYVYCPTPLPAPATHPYRIYAIHSTGKAELVTHAETWVKAYELADALNTEPLSDASA